MVSGAIINFKMHVVKGPIDNEVLVNHKGAMRFSYHCSTRESRHSSKVYDLEIFILA